MQDPIHSGVGSRPMTDEEVRHRGLEADRRTSLRRDAATASEQYARSDQPKVSDRGGKEMLAEYAMECAVEQNDINVLLRALPMELPYEADRALLRLVNRARSARR